MLNLDNHNDSLVKIIAENGKLVNKNTGLFFINLGELLDILNISEERVKELLSNSVLILYKSKYNAAIEKINNRTKTLENDDYFNFSSF